MDMFSRVEGLTRGASRAGIGRPGTLCVGASLAFRCRLLCEGGRVFREVNYTQKY